MDSADTERPRPRTPAAGRVQSSRNGGCAAIWSSPPRRLGPSTEDLAEKLLMLHEGATIADLLGLAGKAEQSATALLAEL